jgi:clathrin heavy chain
VNAACVAAGEFRLAQQCGLHIIVSPDHLEELIGNYEKWGHFEELISLLEQGLGQEHAHQGIFTELGILYAKYRPEKVMEHVKVYWSRVNVSKLLRAIEMGRHWEAAAFLYIETGDFDQGVRVMIKHSPVAYNSDRFLEIIQKV